MKRPSESILVIEDEKPFVETYRRLLRAEGYEIEAAATPDEALQKAAAGSFGVVILDQKLQGGSGPDLGLDLIAGLRERSPGSQIIIATAFPDERAIERAFGQGVYDYLEKGQLLGAFLKAKVRNAMAIVREREHALLGHAAREQRIRETWEAVRAEADLQRKGRLLEELMVLVFKSIPGFEQTWPNRQNELEEIDVLVQNNSVDPFWRGEGQYLLVECKNWSKPVDVNELKLFWLKLERRFQRCRLGFFVAVGGFAKTVRWEQWTRRNGTTLVMLLGPEVIDRLVTSADRSAVLKDLHAAAVMAEGDTGKG